ncbi:MAG: hypothetical protein ORN49_01230 [Rhodobacteraceae bacterium]|nr:hypothetical protein [Paracoccaceae bacterium]
MAGETGTKASHKFQIGGACLRSLAQDRAGGRVDQQKAAPAGKIGQPPRPQRHLHLRPVLRPEQRLRDEKPKAPEELLVDDFVTPRCPAFAALDFQPDQIAQHGHWAFTGRRAQIGKPLPLAGVTRIRGSGHLHDRTLSKLG